MLIRSPSRFFLFLLLATSAAQTDAAIPIGKAHVYKEVGEGSLTLYVTKPADWQADDKCPAIVFYHGGAWVGGAPGQFTEHSKYLASRGMVCVQVQYRLLDKKNNDPPQICVEDAKSAMRWVRSRAGELGIDPLRIASAGGSASGHLAAFVGMVEGGDASTDDKSVPAKSNAMVLFNAVFDNGPGGWGSKRVGDHYKEFSPFHNVSNDDPPALVFLGSDDKLIPVKTAYDFQSMMKKEKVRCEVMIFDGQPHGFFNHGRAGNKYYYETVLAMDKFLASLGWLEGAPTLEKP
ncbi:MAG: lipase [Planctomycetaceae bacterium]|nr:lipase [Planctomycetaceae bacterium]